METKPTVLSAIQPTGDLHLGNYFGAVKNWVTLQEKYQCFYGVVDYHSITMPYNPKKLRENTWNMAFQLMACGVKPENLFIQSMVPEHAELCWILGCIVSYGDLSRMTQFKDKSDLLRTKDKDAFVSGGLFYYPVLQAADILIYRADYVPVGKDQDQHLELSRRIANRFNSQFNVQYLKEPAPLYTEVPKVLSLADPSRKMSKSLGEKHYVNLFGDPDRIRKQVRSAVTDAGDTPAGKMSDGVENLFNLLRASGGEMDFDKLKGDFDAGELRYSELKEAVAESLVALTGPFREKLEAIKADKKDAKQKIKASSALIRERARETLREVKEIAGLLS